MAHQASRSLIGCGWITCRYDSNAPTPHECVYVCTVSTRSTSEGGKADEDRREGDTKRWVMRVKGGGDGRKEPHGDEEQGGRFGL